MKKGDIIIMPGETIPEGETMSVGIIMTDAPDPNARRVDVLWLDAEGTIESEPQAWLQCIGHISQWGLEVPQAVQRFSS